MQFLKPNLETKGRWIRALSGLVMLTASILVWRFSAVAGVVLLGSSVFVLFEAARGWCVLRACGIRTKF